MRPILMRGTAWLAKLYRLYCATLRVRFVMPDGSIIRLSEYAFSSEIVALCERDALVLAGVAAGRSFTALVAHGRDGNWASAAAEAIGFRVVRGSSRAGGARALLSLIRRLDASADSAAIVV